MTPSSKDAHACVFPWQCSGLEPVADGQFLAKVRASEVAMQSAHAWTRTRALALHAACTLIPDTPRVACLWRFNRPMPKA
eukprot:14089266-Alexandrium_andersonii.AAC.1